VGLASLVADLMMVGVSLAAIVGLSLHQIKSASWREGVVVLTHKEDQEVEVTLIKPRALHYLQMFHLVHMDLGVGMDRL
jgi:hypothetical protein